jgi:flagellar motor component MotA
MPKYIKNYFKEIIMNEKDESFDFNDIQLLDNRAIQILMRSLESETIAYALADCSEEIRDSFFRNMSSRSKKVIVDIMCEINTNTDKERIYKDKQYIIQEVKYLEKIGMIVINMDRGDTEIDDQIYKDHIRYKEIKKSITDFHMEERYQVNYKSTFDHNRFVKEYFNTLFMMYKYSRLSLKEGLLALEDYIDNIGDEEDKFVKLGFQFVVDGTCGTIVKEILSNYVERETDFYFKIIREIQLEGILGIQNGTPTSDLMFILSGLNKMVKDIKIESARVSYINGEAQSFIHLFNDDSFINYISKKYFTGKREEIWFINKVLTFSTLARQEGLLALEKILDSIFIAKDDIFELGILLALDGRDGDFIESVLNKLILSKTDKERKDFYLAQKAAALSIQEGISPRILFERLLSYFGDDISEMAREIFKEDMK